MKTKSHKVLSLMLTLILLIAAVPTAMVSASTATTYKGVDYAPVYDYNFYMGHPDLKKVYGNNPTGAFNHFVKYGMKEGRQASPNFNVEIYKANYADLRNAFGNDLPSYYKHYVQFGIKEGRNAVTSLNGGGSSSTSSSSSSSTSSGGSSSSASSSSSSTSEWTVSKATDGSRAIVLKNNRTGKTYTVTNSTDYAKIRYGKDVDQGISTEFTNLLNNFFGAVYIPGQGGSNTNNISHVHVYSVIEENDHSYVYCSKCNKKFTYNELKISLDYFSSLIYSCKFDKLSGKLSKKNSEKYNTGYKWLSFTLGISNSRAKEVLNNYEGDLSLQINNADKLIGFIDTCNTLANLYGFSYAESLSSILGKASLCTVFLNPSSTTMDKYIAVVSHFNAALGFLLKTYDTVGKGLEATAVISERFKYAQIFDIFWWDNYKIFFTTRDLKTINEETFKPIKSPTYKELFAKEGNRTRLDRLVNSEIGTTTEYRDFKYLCAHKNSYKALYFYVVTWLVRPALEKEFEGCTNFATIEELVAALDD